MQTTLNLGLREMFCGLSGRKKFTLKELSCELGGPLPTDGLCGQELSWPGAEGPWKPKPLGWRRIWASPKAGQSPRGCPVCDRNIWTRCFIQPDCEGLFFFED